MHVPHYFVAVRLPAFLKDYYAGWQHGLKDKLPFKQWPHPEDLHITLKFLGAVEPDYLQTLIRAMKPIEKLHAFSLKTGPLGTFGNTGKPRVLWAGVEQKPELIHLQEHVEHIAVRAGFQQEKRAYSPHITLAKKWAAGVKDLSELKEHYDEQQAFTVNQIVIYRIYPEKNPKYHVTTAYHLIRGGA